MCRKLTDEASAVFVFYMTNSELLLSESPLSGREHVGPPAVRRLPVWLASAPGHACSFDPILQLLNREQPTPPCAHDTRTAGLCLRPHLEDFPPAFGHVAPLRCPPFSVPALGSLSDWK